MAEVASAYVSIMPSARGFGSKLQSQVGPQTDSVGKRVGAKFGKAFTIAGVAGIAAVGGLLKGSLDEAREAQKVTALTNSTIKATGGAAGVTAKQVASLAGALSNKTGIDDEVIQSGQNMLLTFKNVRNEAGKGNDIFSQSTKTLIDMSAAMGTEPKQAAIQLGKALNDPIKGISALSRVGVTFTAGQRDQIKALVASGKTMSAQKIILKELNSEFGGAAAAQATSGDKARVAFGNLQEQIGTALLPTVHRVANTFTNKVVPAISTFVAQIQSGAGAGGKFAATAQQMGAAIASVAGFVNQHRTAAVALIATITALIAVTRIHAAVMAVEAAGGLLKMLSATKLVTAVTRTYAAVQWLLNAALTANPIGIVIVAIAALAAGLVLAYKKSETFRAIVNGVFSFLKSAVSATLGFIKSHWQLIVVIIGGPIAAAAILVAKNWSRIKSVVSGAISAVIGFIKSNWKAILATLIAGPFGLAVSLIVSHWGRIKSAVSSGIGRVVSTVGTLPGKILSALGSLGSLLYNSGRELISGLISGITSKIGDVGSAMGGIASKIKGYLPGSPVKEGPLKSWNNGKAGIRLMNLLAKGIRSGRLTVSAAVVSILKGLREKLLKQRDGLKSTLDQLKGDFASLRDSVASSFTSDLFGATATEATAGSSNLPSWLAGSGDGSIAGPAKTAGQNFVSNLLAKRGELKGLLAAFKKLKGWGLNPAFLSQLFASGNGGLILDLAAMGKSGARQAGSLFGEVTSLSNQLGTNVAKNDPVTARIDATNKKLDRVIKGLDAVGPAVGAAINSVSSKSAKKGSRK